MSFLTNQSFVNTYFAMLPIELIEYVRCYYYKKSALVIQYRVKYNIYKKINELTKLCDFAFLKCNFSPNMSNYSIFYKNRLLHRKDVFQTFAACNCCNRHQINKPKQLKLWHENPFHFTQQKSCNCACRHISRFLCRGLEN
jgi:hypothetical protein